MAFGTRGGMNRAFLTDCDAKDAKDGVGGGTYRPDTAINRMDLYELWRLFVVQGLTAWFIKPQAWPILCALMGRLNVALNPDRTMKSLPQIEAVRRGQPDMLSALAIERGFYAGRYEERLLYLRCYRPGGGLPLIRIHGQEHVDAADEADKGIILWAGNFAFNDLIAKIAWSELGLDVSHYTRPVHGFSKTRFGLKVLNPVRTFIENKYLYERVSAEENMVAAMRVLRRRLDEGGAISITAGNRGRQLAEAPFLGGVLRLATGAPALARASGATILPVYTLRADDGSFDVTIGAPLTSQQSNKDAYAKEIVAQYADQLAPYVRDFAEQWRGWRYTAALDSAPLDSGSAA